METTTPWVTIAEAAALLNMSRDTVRREIARGNLNARRVSARLIRIDPASIAALLEGLDAE